MTDQGVVFRWGDSDPTQRDDDGVLTTLTNHSPPVVNQWVTADGGLIVYRKIEAPYSIACHDGIQENGLIAGTMTVGSGSVEAGSTNQFPGKRGAVKAVEPSYFVPSCFRVYRHGPTAITKYYPSVPATPPVPFSSDRAWRYVLVACLIAAGAVLIASR